MRFMLDLRWSHYFIYITNKVMEICLDRFVLSRLILWMFVESEFDWFSLNGGLFL